MIFLQVPYYKGEHVAFDIVPPVVEFEVNQGSVVIEEPFQVAGFSVYGRVVNKKGVCLSVKNQRLLVGILHNIPKGISL